MARVCRFSLAISSIISYIILQVRAGVQPSSQTLEALSLPGNYGEGSYGYVEMEISVSAYQSIQRHQENCRIRKPKYIWSAPRHV